MKKLERLPIGQSDFKNIIENNRYCYFDKNMFIKEIIESGDVILITRPRRFEKRLNMSSLNIN
jgi:hypothetical protein